jgi:hypothetical protein
MLDCSALFSLEMIGSVGFRMLKPSHIRLLFRAFLMAWYFMCGFASLLGLVIFTLSLASMLNIFGAQLKMESSWRVVGISLAFVFVPIGFMFIGRSWTRPFLARLEEMDEQRQARDR